MVNGQQIRLPAQSTGDFTFGSAGTSSPFGPVSGSGFLSPNQDFFFYTLRETENANNLATIFGGGTPLATESFPISGLAVHRYQAGHPIPDVAGGDVLGLIDEYTLYSAYGVGFGNDQLNGLSGGAAVVFDGSGPAQRSAMIGTSFGYFHSRLVEGGPREGPFESLGGTRASTRQSSTGHPVRVSSSTGSMFDENGNSFFGVDAPDFFVTSPQNSAFTGIRRLESTGLYQPLIATDGNQGRFHANWFALRISPPADLGTRQTASTLNGYAGGIVEIRMRGGDFEGDYVFNSNPDDSGRVTVPGVSPSGQTGLWIATNASDNWVHAEMGIENAEGPNNSFYRFGNPPTGSQNIRSLFVDDSRFIARDLTNSHVQAIGEGFMGDNPIIRMDGVLATAELLGHLLPDGVTPCDCEYLRWGYWSADARRETTFEDRNNDREAVHIASWVAGEIPDAVDIPTTGTAAYAGHIVGNVKNGANYYVSAGRFTQQYNFGTDTGAFAVTNFDGANYSGAIAASSLRNDFQGAGIQGSSNRTMNLRGSFFKSPSQGAGAIPAYVGGDFNVTGNGYKAGGTFAGER